MKIKLILFFVLLVAVGNVMGQANKATVCHQNGNGSFRALLVGQNAVAAHIGHGDVLPGASAGFGLVYDNSCAVVNASPNFTAFIIRNSNVGAVPPTITENPNGDGFYAFAPLAGQKVGYGTNFFDGLNIQNIESADFTIVAQPVGLHPYLNIWVTDGTNYAIIASENVYMGTNFSTRIEWKVFEYNVTGLNTTHLDLDWLCANGNGDRVSQYLTCGGVNASFSDLVANLMIQSPNPMVSYAGGGAPKAGYGFNVIWGDTAANFINGPISIANLSVTANGTEFFASN